MAVPPLESLVEAGHEIVLVITGIDKRRGRGAETSPSPVKAAARRLGLPVSHDIGDVLDAAGLSSESSLRSARSSSHTCWRCCRW